MVKTLRNAFAADLKARHAWSITSLLVGLGLIAEINHSVSYAAPLKRFIVPILVTASLLVSLTRVLAAVLKQLLRVIEESAIASKRDLLLIAFTYFCVIAGFGILYLVLETLMGKAIFDFGEFQTRIRLIDRLYLSGLTITTGGDILPVYWFSKFLLVLESLVGVWLTAIVLGFFIGSLLGSQQQLKQAKWYAELQQLYVGALDNWATVVSDLESKLETIPPTEAVRGIRELRQELLKTIADLVEYQYAPGESARVCANWMQFYRPSEAASKHLEIARDYSSPSYLEGGNITSLWGVLVMRDWGEKPDGMPGDGELVIPVYDGKSAKERISRQLPGAPLAILKPNGLDVVSDSDTIDLSNQDEGIRAKFKDYFDNHRAELRSFASVRISQTPTSTIQIAESTESTVPLGVVNVQSKGAVSPRTNRAFSHGYR